ncbi:uncharacterized protein LOC114538114 [Dendronephthya gigantea]|uniref:uncharacterized protein LOC114538114 n=1 Tax=Dendronephthya gigantea TaxID=151771 RepID=UPI00106BD52B|nr:uncharacterized protein LOC114538114 [Dendronephthya gigantea]
MATATSSNPWASFFTEQFDRFTGYVKDEITAYELIKAYEIATTSRFTVFKQTTGFSDTTGNENAKTHRKHRVRWQDPQETTGFKLEFDGIPFEIAGIRILDCQNGPDKNKAKKEKEALKKFEHADGVDHSYNHPKRRFLVQDTKRCGCPARIHMRKIVKFPDFQITEDKKKKKEMMSKILRDARFRDESIVMEKRIYITLPQEKDHSFHLTGKISGLLQPIDERLVKKIQELVSNGVNRVSEMQHHLQYYVKKEIFAGQQPPEVTNRRFFPTSVDVRNHMYRATVQQRHSNIDQENLESKIKEWQKENPDDKFYFRPYSHVNTGGDDGKSDEDDGDYANENDHSCDDDIVEIKQEDQLKNLLLVHQTQWQRKLLERYGGDICLLDATYKTSRYALPMFFMCVKTNVDYCVVASFVVQQEDANSIWEALHILQGWNPNWNPDFFMVDFCEAEINAIERLFPNCLVYLCDFHREQAWVRWVNKGKNGVTKEQKDKLLTRLRAMAKAPNEEEFQTTLTNLKSDELWKTNKLLQDWMNKTWLPEKKRWVWAYRKDRFNVKVNTNNGVERQNRSLKYQFLADNRDKTLSGLISVVVTQFLPSAYKK